MLYLLHENTIPALWLIFALYWVVAAVRQRRAMEHETVWTRLSYLVVAAIAFLFLLYERDNIAVLWVLLGLYVAFALLRIRDTKQTQSLLTRLPHIAALIVAFILLLETKVHLGFLDRRFLSNSQSVTWIGIGLTSCGIALAIWARSYLGANWSATITIRSRHSLVRTGPYSRIRHPIYSGLLIAIGGTALSQGTWRGLLALAIAVIAWAIKARKEESWLRNEFGAQFEEYCQRTGFLLPRLTY